MPSAKQPERGRKSPYQARYRLSIGPCTGLDLSTDAASIPDTALRQAINVRVHDGIVVNRLGQSLLPNNPGNDCIQGMIDIPNFGTKMVMADLEGTPSSQHAFVDESLASGSNYFQMADRIPAHPNPGDNNGADYEDTNPRFAYIWWDGQIVFQDADSTALHKLIIPDDEQVGTAFLDKVQSEALFDLQVPGEGSAITVSSMTILPATDGRSQPPLYFGTMAGGVVAYSQGQLIRLLADATFSGRVIVFTYNNRLYAVGPQEIQYQDNGWSDGGSPTGTSFSTVAMPAGPVDFRPMDAIEHGGFAYICGYDDNDNPPSLGTDSGYILRINDSGGGTPTAIVSINAAPGGQDLASVDVFAVGISNQLFVGWRDISVGAAAAHMGDWDGTSALSIDVSFGGDDQGMIQRMQGNTRKIYMSAYADGVEQGAFSWDGTSRVQVADSGGQFAPYDFVLY